MVPDALAPYQWSSQTHSPLWIALIFFGVDPSKKVDATRAPRNFLDISFFHYVSQLTKNNSGDAQSFLEISSV